LRERRREMENRGTAAGFVFILVFMFFAALSNDLCGAGKVFAADQPIKLRVLSSWGTEQSYTNEYVVAFVDKVNKRAAGRLQLSWVGPEAVPPFEQLKPLSTGVFDILFSHAAYHMGEVAIAIGMDLIKGDAPSRRAAGFLDVLDEGYKKANAKVIGFGCLGEGYLVMLKKELKKADFTGLKLRTTPSYDPLVKALGGASVRIASGEIYSSLEKGVVDGACQTAFGAWDMKLYEVAKYMLKPFYGEVVELYYMNLNSWGKLPKDLQDLLLQVLKEVEVEGRKNLIAKYEKDEAEMLRRGMVLNVLPPAEAAKLIRTYYDRSWEEIVLKHAPDAGPKLKKLADEYIKTHKQE
jgi:TRAP-type C4-dicarboxylate transport system substrate-binding protein